MTTQAAVDPRPPQYRVLVDQGWVWASATPPGFLHLVPPAGDRALCGREAPRNRRYPSTTQIAERACHHCWHRALGDTPRRTS